MRRLAFVLGWLLLACSITHAQFVSGGLFNNGQATTSPTPPPPSYTGPGDVVGSALGFYSVRGYSTAYSSGSNKTLTTVTRASDSHTCDFLIASNGNLGNTTNCSTGGDNGSSAATWCAATTCAINTAFDQSASSNSGVQATSASQPTMNISTSPFTGFSTSFNFSSANATYWLLGTGAGPTRSTFTYIVWLRVNSTAAELGIMGGDNQGPAMRMDAGGQIRTFAPGLTANLCTSATSLVANTWTQVATTFDNSTGVCKIYINSVLDVTTTTATQTFSITNSYLGGAFAEAEWDGQIAEVMMYGTVLTQTQITNIFNNATSNP